MFLAKQGPRGARLTLWAGAALCTALQGTRQEGPLRAQGFRCRKRPHPALSPATPDILQPVRSTVSLLPASRRPPVLFPARPLCATHTRVLPRGFSLGRSRGHRGTPITTSLSLPLD